jgi:Permeases of the drug/metabolite transporter (DMT) superfamily
MKKHLGLAGLLLVAIIWGNGFVANEIALRDMSPLQIMCARFFIAAVIMVVFTFNKLRKIDRKVWLAGILLGSFLFIGFVFQTIGLKYTTPSKNAFLTATNVVIVPFIAFVLYKKKVDRFSVCGAIMAIIGIAVLSLQGNLTLGVGDLLTLLCAISFAFHIFFTSEFVKKYDAIAITTVQMIVAFVLSLIVVIVTRDYHFNVSNSSWASVIYLGVFSTTVAFFLQSVSQKYTEETTAAVVMSMESVFGTLFSILIVNEPVTRRMICGSILILFAVIISETKLKGIIKSSKLVELE